MNYELSASLVWRIRDNSYEEMKPTILFTTFLHGFLFSVIDRNLKGTCGLDQIHLVESMCKLTICKLYLDILSQENKVTPTDSIKCLL